MKKKTLKPKKNCLLACCYCRCCGNIVLGFFPAPYMLPLGYAISLLPCHILLLFCWLALRFCLSLTINYCSNGTVVCGQPSEQWDTWRYDMRHRHTHAHGPKIFPKKQEQAANPKSFSFGKCIFFISIIGRQAGWETGNTMPGQNSTKQQQWNCY